MNEFGFKSPLFNKDQMKTNNSTNKEMLGDEENSLQDIAAKILPVFLLNMLSNRKNTLNTNLLESLSPPILRLFGHSEDKKDEIHQDCEVIMTDQCKKDTEENVCHDENKYYNVCHDENRYYFDKSGFPIDECERHRVHSECKNIIETCCIIEIPSGFRLVKCSPEMCFNLSGLSCLKSPIMQKVSLETCNCEHPMQCEVVAGYELRAVGEVNFSLSLPICPINGHCTQTHSHACCSSTVPINEIISHTCCSKPCNCKKPCVDWTFGYYCTTLVENDCFSYVRVKMGIAIEYTGNCECDEE